MQKAVTITYWMFLIFVASIVLLNVVGYVTFGYGLGDIHLLTILIIKFALITIFFILLNRSSKRGIRVLFLAAVFITTCFIALKISLFRSKEYPWNGKIFVAEQQSYIPSCEGGEGRASDQGRLLKTSGFVPAARL